MRIEYTRVQVSVATCRLVFHCAYFMPIPSQVKAATPADAAAADDEMPISLPLPMFVWKIENSQVMWPPLYYLCFVKILMMLCRKFKPNENCLNSFQSV